jgi:hypothetical protein
VALPFLVWVLNMRGNYKVASITFNVEQILLVLSCIVLIWGIARLARILKDLSNLLANKVMILMHIVAYLFIIAVNIVQTAAYYKGGLRAFEITTICLFVVYFVCTLIFGLIVNTIVTKIIAADIQNSQSIASLLMTSMTAGSV